MKKKVCIDCSLGGFWHVYTIHPDDDEIKCENCGKETRRFTYRDFDDLIPKT